MPPDEPKPSAESDLGGDPPCMAHQVDWPRPDLDNRVAIRMLVRDFYRAAAMDDLLGPVFATARVDWPSHIDTLTDFWAWQLLGERGYEGNPLRAHEPVHRATPFTAAHYDRWLDLFESEVDEHYAGPYAALAKTRARRMARALRRLLEGADAPGDVPIEVLTVRRPQ
jgi:hemoglobin